MGLAAFAGGLTKKHVGAAGVFFWLCTWTMAVASTAINDWNYWEPIGLREGLWQSCLFQRCMQNNYYFGSCAPMLSTVRAFSLLVIFAALTSMLFQIMLCFTDSISGIIWSLLTGFVTMCATVIPWTVYLGFVNYPCVLVNGSRGAGWCLAVTYMVMAILAFFFMVWSVFLEIRPSFRRQAAPLLPCPAPMVCPAPLMVDPCCMGMGGSPLMAPSTPMSCPAMNL